MIARHALVLARGEGKGGGGGQRKRYREWVCVRVCVCVRTSEGCGQCLIDELLSVSGGDGTVQRMLHNDLPLSARLLRGSAEPHELALLRVVSLEHSRAGR